MTKLEILALEQLSKRLRSIAERCDMKNADRMNHERLFILKDVQEALDIADAIDESNDYKYGQKEMGGVNTIGLR